MELNPFAAGCSLATALSAQNNRLKRTFLAGVFMNLILACGQALAATGAAAATPDTRLLAQPRTFLSYFLPTPSHGELVFDA